MKWGLFLVLFHASIVSLMADANLIRNGDFSKIRANGTPEYWSGKMDEGSGIDRESYMGKGNAFRLKKTKKSLSQRIKVDGGKVYEVSYFLKTDFPKWLTAASFQILWLDGDGKPLFTDYKRKKVWNMTIKNIQGSRDWQKIELTGCSAPKEAAWADIYLGIAFDTNGTCWFTDISFKEVKRGCEFANRIATIPYSKTEVPVKDFFQRENWKNSAVFNDFLVPTTNARAKNQTSAEVFYTSKAIYLNIKCYLPGADKLKIDKLVDFSMQESCEVFLRPPGIKHQYQIFVTADGTMRAFTETWNDGNWPMKCYPWKENGIICKVEYAPDFWRLGLCIPFKGLNTEMPADRAEWRMNICRGNYAAKPRELSAWSALREAHFQFPDDFGKVIFAKNTPVVKDICIDANGATLLVYNPQEKDLRLTASFVKHTASGAWQTAGSDFQIPARQKRNFTSYVPTKDASMRFLELRMGKNVIVKHCNMPSEKYYALGIFDPEGVRGKTLNIAVDHPFFLGLNMRHNSDGKTAHRLVERHEKPFDLYLEVPDGLKFNGMIFDAGEWRQSGLVKPDVASFLRDGKTMKRYRFELPLIINWPSPVYMFFYECSLPAGEVFSGSYYLTENGKELPRNELKFRTMKIGSVKRIPKAFGHDMFYMDAKIIKSIFPQDTLKHYTQLGMNRISVNIQKGKTAGLFSGEFPRTREDYYDLLFGEMKKTGNRLFFTSNSSSATPLAWRWTDQDKDARAIGADGKDAPYNQYNYPSLCPTYRGRFFREHAENLMNSYLFRKYKCTWLTLDLELWPAKVWEKLCFCPRCLAKFKAYAEKNRPAFASIDVRRVFQEGTNQEFMAFWNEYKGYVHAQFVRDLTDPVKNRAVGNSPSSPWKDFMIGEWCKPRAHLLNVINLFELGLYYTPDVVYRHFEEIYKKWGDKKKNWYPTFTFGQTEGCPDFHLKADQLPELIYEAAIYGAQGICWFHYAYIEPLRLKYVVDGINTIVPFEDLIVKGNIISEVNIDNPQMQLTARKHGDEGLIAIRASQASVPTTGKVKFQKLTGHLDVFDCISGRKLATVAPEKTSFSFTVKPNRCRLLYFGNSKKWNERIK